MFPYTDPVTETKTFLPGSRWLLTMPHPHFSNVPPTVEVVTVRSVTVYGNVWVAAATYDIKVSPDRLSPLS